MVLVSGFNVYPNEVEDCLYSFFIVITSSLVTLFYRRLTTKEELRRDQAKIEPAKA